MVDTYNLLYPTACLTCFFMVDPRKLRCYVGYRGWRAADFHVFTQS